MPVSESNEERIEESNFDQSREWRHERNFTRVKALAERQDRRRQLLGEGDGAER